MKLNSPLPQPLSKECAKAAKIFKSFIDSGNNGLDGVIPRSILEQAKGFAIFTIVKAGFIFSARAGSGIVIARLDDGTWSPPSAIGTAGVGFGGQAGAEVTDFLVVLNSRSAVRSFMAAGSLTLGGNMSVALGPLGRNGEASGALNTNGKVAAMYSYSKTRGLFGGVSLEGSVIVERQDANALAYNSPVTARMLLGGMVDQPEWAIPLIKTIEACTGLPNGRTWINDSPRDSYNRQYSFGEGVGSAGSTPQPTGSLSSTPSFLKRKKKPEQFPPASWGAPSESGSYFSNPPTREPSQVSDFGTNSASRSNFRTQFDSNYDAVPALASKARAHDDSIPPYQEDPMVISTLNRNKHTRSTSLFNASSRAYTSAPTANTELNGVVEDYDDPFNPSPSNSKSLHTRRHTTMIQPKPELARPLFDGIARAIALYNFQAAESGDLSFSKGDVITITKKSNSTDDWWTGKLNGREGIFPANFVELA
ncbi:hypothetical protein DFP72DRAFT_20932 [Ephemerocybe angulata]|uniref:SH3 domain-containing protein n=1 Tax=Ephemerocybe angulata TaxID=980116 RepID=A0A8H6IJ20_9AGAR|nr:hypothetical protein DFP72DRAFT_20932 [Tulosesus angulatus]